MSMEIKNVDLNKAMVRYPITKTKAFQMPLSDFQIELSRDCIENNVEEFGADCPWVFPSATSETGHLEEKKFLKSEAKLFKEVGPRALCGIAGLPMPIRRSKYRVHISGR
jgi:hypothetical protein